MKTRADITLQNHKKGYNCAQSITCTYCDLVNLDEKTAFMISEGFGAGMGSLQGNCGALTGACIIAGLKNSTGNLEKPNSKAVTYGYTKEIVNRFLEKSGSLTCKELKGIESGNILCSCDQCILNAAEILEEVVFPD